jgi:aminopeptidase N
MLRRVMGDEKFFAGIRDYYQTYRDRNALTDDLRKVMETHYGLPLDWFFKQWVFEPGYPVYDATWSWDEMAKALKLRVAQKQSPTVFRMPLDVEFKTGGATRREVIQVNEREQTFNFKLDAKPQSVALDPDEWVLKVLTINEGR